MIQFLWKRLFLLLLPICLTGCVNYDVGINIAGLHQGQIVQHIQLGEQLTSFSQADVEDWLGSLQKRAKQLGGSTERLSSQEMELTIPFANAEQLESKFNRFFNPNTRSQPPSELVQLDSQLTTQQNNFVLFQRTHLKLNIDLTALGTIKGDNSRIVGANSLLDLEFRLNTPWGMEIIAPDPAANSSLVKQTGGETVWYLQPGENNQIEVVFWLPEPLGFGAIAILAIVYIGISIKNRQSSPTASAVSQN
jgi:hypothetical protein